MITPRCSEKIFGKTFFVLPSDLKKSSGSFQKIFPKIFFDDWGIYFASSPKGILRASGAHGEGIGKEVFLFALSLPIMMVNEIFYSLQGEGINTGRAAIFVRLSRCNLRCAFCDTEFDSGQEMSLEAIATHIAQYPGRLIIWTGGEPTLQLTEEVVAYFKTLGYTQAIETNGTRRPPRGLDYITCSPKPEAMKRLHESFPEGVSEFRFPISAEGPLPPPIEELPRSDAYLVSPIFVGEDADQMDRAAVERCVAFVLDNPTWRLSLQTHKLINIR